MKCWCLLLILHGVTSHNTVISTATTMRASSGFTNFTFSVKFLVFKSVSTERAAQVLTFLICFPDVPGLYSGRNNNCHNWGNCWDVRCKGRPVKCHDWHREGRRWVEVLLHSCLTSALNKDGWSTPRPGRFTPWERAAVPITEEPGWASGPVWTSVDNRKVPAPHLG